MCITGTREKDFLLGLLCISSAGNIEVRYRYVHQSTMPQSDCLLQDDMINFFQFGNSPLSSNA